MCTPQTMERVAALTNRRSFLRKMGATTVAAGLTTVVGCDVLEGTVAAPFTGTATASLRSLSVAFSRVIDCTHVLEPDIPNYFRLNMEITPILTVEENGVYVNRLTIPEHFGTHFDTPSHFIAGGATGESILPGQLVGPLVVIDVADRASRDPNTEVTVADLAAWEARNGRIPRGAFVAMYSDWARRWPTAAYLNESGGVYNFPGFGEEASEFLIRERDIIGIGCDSHSLDVGPSADFPAHYTVLGAGKIGVENLAGLGDVMQYANRGRGEGLPLMVIGGLKTRRGSGSPVRALALV